MPERWHFTGHERIAPIYCVPEVGWAITDRQEQLNPLSGFEAAVCSRSSISVSSAPPAKRRPAEGHPEIGDRLIFLDDILGEDGYKAITHNEGEPDAASSHSLVPPLGHRLARVAAEPTIGLRSGSL
jgi:hypothetical protein